MLKLYKQIKEGNWGLLNGWLKLVVVDATKNSINDFILS